MQRIEAHLENIYSGEDGETLCGSAPHSFYGKHFDHPDSCANWVSLCSRPFIEPDQSTRPQGDHGIFGIWDIEDPNC